MIIALDRLFKSRIFFWIRINQFILAICIFTFVALMPADFVQTHQPDKVMHFFGNTLLFLSAYAACGGRLKLWIVILLLIPYSILIEASQWFTSTRHVDPEDAIANISGLLTGFLIASTCEFIWGKIKPKRSQQP